MATGLGWIRIPGGWYSVVSLYSAQDSVCFVYVIKYDKINIEVIIN